MCKQSDIVNMQKGLYNKQGSIVNIWKSLCNMHTM